jgi:hypothetical protein
MLLWVCLFSFVLFKMLQVVHVWIQPSDRYREPKGDSLKVNGSLYTDASNGEWLREISDRLRQFYFSGE